MRAFCAFLVLLLLGAAAYAAETITYSYDARGRLIQVARTGQ
jgi:YD repeat-containing protein